MTFDSHISLSATKVSAKAVGTDMVSLEHGAKATVLNQLVELIGKTVNNNNHSVIHTSLHQTSEFVSKPEFKLPARLIGKT